MQHLSPGGARSRQPKRNPHPGHIGASGLKLVMQAGQVVTSASKSTTISVVAISASLKPVFHWSCRISALSAKSVLATASSRVMPQLLPQSFSSGLRISDWIPRFFNRAASSFMDSSFPRTSTAMAS